MSTILKKKTERMRVIRDAVVALSTSPLYAYRIENGYHAVLGEGNHDATIVFIGEAPGKNEAQTGRPFCGAAGRILDKLLASAGIPRADVYITNIVKDRPPENRDPHPDEISAYAPFLDQQLEAIEPKAIVPLGRYSMDYIMRRFGLEFDIEPISRAHGKEFAAHATFGDIAIIPLYHPAVATYNGSMYGELERDFQVLKKYHTPKTQM